MKLLQTRSQDQKQQIAKLELAVETLEKKNRRLKKYLYLTVAPYAVILSPILFPLYLARNFRKKRKYLSMRQIAGAVRSVPAAVLDPVHEAKIDAIDDTFALCRVIGNDLFPRHKRGQSYENVKFILENEPQFENCKKLWILNRIFDAQEEERLVSLLKEHGQRYRVLPFDKDRFLDQGFNFEKNAQTSIFFDGSGNEMEPYLQAQLILQAYRSKNNCVMNNNGARNSALEFCLEHAKWALPFDGNCFFNQTAWDAFRSGVLAERDKLYFVVPMARITENKKLLDPAFQSESNEEPQLAFRCDASVRFNEEHPYGRRPKVEMLVHLGITGPWDKWRVADFDCLPRTVSPDGHRVGCSGWVARLFSGKVELEHSSTKSALDRGVARTAAIRQTLDGLEARMVDLTHSQSRTQFYSMNAINDQSLTPDSDAFRSIVANAQEALARGPYSVIQKTELPPSNNTHDYFNPAPYWWPDPKKKDGLPYVRRDGQRVPGTVLYHEQSNSYDRTRLQRMFDDTTALALAARLTDNQAYAEHAYNLIHTWFISPDTCMNPNLDFAQVRLGHNNDNGQASGLIETKDMYYFLDAVRLLNKPDLTRAVQKWCQSFYTWLNTSEQGVKERTALNNHGTCFDLQCGALAVFLGEISELQEINFRAQARIEAQFTIGGIQTHEVHRTLSQHYFAFNLQGWLNLFAVLERAGLRPWQSKSAEKLLAGLRWTLENSKNGWPHEQIAPFEISRLVPLDAALKKHSGESVISGIEAPFVFSPYDGVAPYWRMSECT